MLLFIIMLMYVAESYWQSLVCLGTVGFVLSGNVQWEVVYSDKIKINTVIVLLRR